MHKTIVLFTTAHSPLDERIYFKEGLSLKKRYTEAAVVILHPNKFSNQIKKEQNYFGILFHPFRSYGGRLLSIFTAVPSVVSCLKRLNSAIVICHEPDALMLALLYKYLFNSKLKIVYDSHELWGAVFAAYFKKRYSSIAINIFQFFEKRMVSRCDLAFGATWGIANYLSGSLASERVFTILNASSKDIFKPLSINVREYPKKFVICHDGTLNFGKGLVTIFQSIQLLYQTNKNFEFRVIGDIKGAERIWFNDFLKSNPDLESVITITGWLPYEEVGRQYSDCHIGVSASTFKPNSVIAAPNKLFNYMHYGLPIVLPDYMDISHRLTNEHPCAVSADAHDPQSYADSISFLMSDEIRFTEYSMASFSYSRKYYNWDIMEEKLYLAFSSLFSRDHKVSE